MLPARDGSSHPSPIYPKEAKSLSSEDSVTWELPASLIPLTFRPLFRADSSPHQLEALAPWGPDAQPLSSVPLPSAIQNHRLGADT